MEILPSQEEVEKQFLFTLRHAYSVEYFLHLFDAGHDDPQRPHDLVGEGNRLSLPVLLGLSFQHRDEEGLKERYIKPAVNLHREFQFHHQMWNPPHPDASDDSMKVGAIDTVCSLREDRAYQGGVHTFQQIYDKVTQTDHLRNHPRKVEWVIWSLMKIYSAYAPDFKMIDLDYIPNFHLSTEIHKNIVKRVEETKSALREKGYRF
ncbi:MAG: hypothetical protein KKA62_03850 [Nanoarchaeota archaeon]|nr:hypothetical protein [Nanoarchaeota archaeon]MBU1643788.1 hypothetical protein [Nanoarchaeota archaeon]MBU1977059.1 hypothetical protein [Nanoarchaeota archaeon]